MKNRIVLIGAGGHCTSCIDVIEQAGDFIIEGILDPNAGIKSLLGYPVLGSDDLLDDLVEKGYSFLITVGQIKSAALRVKLFQQLSALHASMPVVISPKAYVSKHSQISKGTIVHHNVVINSNVQIGANCIINTGSIVEHDTRVGNHCHISTNVVLNGNCNIGDEVFIGSGSIISNGITINDNI